jgi:hypothetical protein
MRAYVIFAASRAMPGQCHHVMALVVSMMIDCQFVLMGVGTTREHDEPRLMAGSPPHPVENLVTLENWQRPPFNRWAFQPIGAEYDADITLDAHGPGELVVAKLSSWPDVLGTPMRRTTVAAVKAIADALSR